MSACRASVESSAAGHRDQRHAQALEHRQDDGDLLALAAVGNRQHQVDRLDHAQVAVAGLGRMHEHRRRAGRGQRGGDLAADVAALAHAHHHHPAAHRQHQLPRRARKPRRCAPSGPAPRPLRCRRFPAPGAAPARRRTPCRLSGAGAHRWTCRVPWRDSIEPRRDSLGSMRAMSSLELTLLYLLAAVLGVVACRSLKLPPMLGYLVVGRADRPERAGAGARTPTACATWASSAWCS